MADRSHGNSRRSDRRSDRRSIPIHECTRSFSLNIRKTRRIGVMGLELLVMLLPSGFCRRTPHTIAAYSAALYSAALSNSRIYLDRIGSTFHWSLKERLSEKGCHIQVL